MGGDALRSAGGEVIFDYKDNSVMGFVEVLRKLPDLFRLRDAFRQVMVERKPDIFVTVDYPDFNMRVAKVAKQLGIPVFSFIPPSAWAWRRGRAKMVARLAAVWPASILLLMRSIRKPARLLNLWAILLLIS